MCGQDCPDHPIGFSGPTRNTHRIGRERRLPSHISHSAYVRFTCFASHVSTKSATLSPRSHQSRSSSPKASSETGRQASANECEHPPIAYFNTTNLASCSTGSFRRQLLFFKMLNQLLYIFFLPAPTSHLTATAAQVHSRHPAPKRDPARTSRTSMHDDTTLVPSILCGRQRGTAACTLIQRVRRSHNPYSGSARS